MERVTELSLGHKVKIQWEAEVEHFQTCPFGQALEGRPRTCWRNHISQLSSEHLGVPKEQLESFDCERKP